MPTVFKALSFMDHFSESRLSIGLSEMARLANIKKTTVYRLMTELQDAAVLRLAKLRKVAVPVLETGRNFLQWLSE